MIELRVRLARPAPADIRQRMSASLGEDWPKVADIRFVLAELRVDGDDLPSSNVGASVVGVRFDSADGRWVVQAKSDGLTISRLRPYESWEALRSKLDEVWPKYREVFEPEYVTRLGVRFINRFSLGRDVIDLDDVLTAGPKIPPTLPQTFLNYSSTVVVPLVELQAAVSIHQTTELVPSSESAAEVFLILDVDAFSEQSLPIDDPRVWEQLEKLRIAKNMAFFGALKETTLGRFV